MILSNYVNLNQSQVNLKVNLKGRKCTDTSTLASKADLARLKTKPDDFDVDKLKPAPVDLSQLSSAVDNDGVKKTDVNNDG